MDIESAKVRGMFFVFVTESEMDRESTSLRISPVKLVTISVMDNESVSDLVVVFQSCDAVRY